MKPGFVNRDAIGQGGGELRILYGSREWIATIKGQGG